MAALHLPEALGVPSCFILVKLNMTYEQIHTLSNFWSISTSNKLTSDNM